MRHTLHPAHMLDMLWQDVRHAMRAVRRSPGFVAVAVVTLALGIGANTAMFSVVYSALLRPLPYRDGDRLVVLDETTPKAGEVSVSYPNFLDWRSETRRLSGMAFVHSVGFDLVGTERPMTVSGEAVSANFLSLLGVRPALGRDFTASEEEPAAAPVAILSHSLWQSRFGADPGVLGRTITLNARPFTIVGVLPAGFRSLDRLDVLVPIGVWRAANADLAAERGARDDSRVIGRLAPGTGLSDARAEMGTIAARLAKEYPRSNDRFGVMIVPVRDYLVGNVRPSLLVLFGAVLFVLLIACGNVANLLLSRGAGRAREIALRVALGASRGRVVSQLLVESLVLALLGGALGLLLAAGGLRALAALVPKAPLGGAAIGLNGTVLLFTAGTILVVTCLFGIVPALRFARPDPHAELKERGRTTSGGASHGRLRALHAGSEITLALVLLTGAGLMMKTMVRLSSVDPGFRVDRVQTMEIDLRAQRYDDDDARLGFWQPVLDRVRALPGVRSAAVGTVVPLTGNHSRTDITIEGMPLPRAGMFPHPDYHFVSPGYLATLEIPLIRGRDFGQADGADAPPVALVNAALARRYFPGQDPVGKRFMFGHPSADKAPEWVTIVGEVGDTKLYGLANPARLEVYLPFRQYPPGDGTLLVKSEGDPGALVSAIRGVVTSVDPDQPVGDVSTMSELRSQSVGERRMTLILLGIFSGLAVLLAAIGVYGVIAYSASRRVPEIAVRMALGAQRRDVLRLVLAQSGRIALAGIGVGVAAALALTRLMTGLLYGVSPSDPLTVVAAAALLGSIALLAGYLPARRAARVDPMRVLREE